MSLSHAELILELPEPIDQRIAHLPIVAQRIRLERAIHAALDAAGWPGKDEVGIAYYFVNLWNRRGELVGHVGPLHDKDDAHRVAESWRHAKHSAVVAKSARGPGLTNRIAG